MLQSVLMRFALAAQGKPLLVMNSERCNNLNLHPKDLIMTMSAWLLTSHAK